MHTSTNEMELIARILKGETQLYASLVEKYQNLVYSIVLKYIKSREDAEEVAQDSFIKAFRSLADFKGSSKFSTWLFTIATTTCLSFLRKKKPEINSLDEEHVFASVDQGTGSFSANLIEGKSRTQMVNQAISMLSEDDARVLTLFYKGEQSLEEIAKILGKETNAVKIQLYRARNRLKEKMETHFSNEVKDLY